MADYIYKGSPLVDALRIVTSSHKPQNYLMNIDNSRSSEYVRLQNHFKFRIALRNTFCSFHFLSS